MPLAREIIVETRSLFSWPRLWRLDTGSASIGGFHYTQRSATNKLSLYRNASAPVNYTSTYTPSGLSFRPFMVGALNGTSIFGGALRHGVFIATDGTLTDAEVVDLYTTLNTYLIIATGR
jgi:hypothetical protein